MKLSFRRCVRYLLRQCVWLVAVTIPASGQTGAPVEELRGVDEAMQAFMQQWNAPGGAMAVAKGGRLIYARGFGMADVEAGQPVEPDSLFRIGSVSKTVTAMAVAKLVEDGKLHLDEKALDILEEYRDAAVDPRALNVTVWHLLTQTSGLILEEDELPPASELAAAGAPLPLTGDFFIRLALAQPLAFDPGEQYLYLSLNAVLLGKIIEKKTGEPYETYMRNHVLGPMGITRMRLGRPFATQRAIGEVRYYDSPGSPEIEPYYPNASGLSPQPYGGVPMEALGATGAWIASPIDLVRFATAIDGSRPPRYLSPQTVQQVLARPASWPEVAQGWYGFGWVVQPTEGDRLWWHNGAMNGSAALLLHSDALAVDVAVTFNTLWAEDEDAFFVSLFDGLLPALAGVRRWPSNDLFPYYYEPSSPRVFAGGVVSAAGLQPGPIAPGQLVSLFGLGLGPERAAGAEFDSQGRLTTELDGVSVTFNGVPAPLLLASDGQITAAVPYGVEPGEAEVVVGRSGASSEPVRARVAASAPALFTESGDGRGQALAVNQDGALNSERNPAAPGTVVALYGTGAGAMHPAAGDGTLSLPPLAQIAAPVRVSVGGREAEVTYAGAAPLLVSGTFQVNVRIPSDVPSGPAAVSITIGDAANAQDATLAVR